MSFVQRLRADTAVDHETVDARFGTFRLDDADDYRRFLLAHARALPAAEAVLGKPGHSPLPAWRPRTPLLAADLAALGTAMPAPSAFALSGEGARWGALYVVEGSRLGGQLLARAVAGGLPSAYLGARHLPGEWRALLAAIEERAAVAGTRWAEDALAGARATFALYAGAVRDGEEDRVQP